MTGRMHRSSVGGAPAEITVRWGAPTRRRGRCLRPVHGNGVQFCSTTQQTPAGGDVAGPRLH